MHPLLRLTARFTAAFAGYVLVAHGAALADCIADAQSSTGIVSNGINNINGILFPNGLPTGGGTQNMIGFSWMQSAIDVVKAVFYALLGIQIIQDVADYMLETAGGGSLSGFFTRYGRMLLINGITVICFINAPTIVTSAFQGASEAGTLITHSQSPAFISDILNPFTFRPGTLAEEGSCLAKNMWENAKQVDDSIVRHAAHDSFGDFSEPKDWNSGVSLFNTFGMLGGSLQTLFPNLWTMLFQLLEVTAATAVASLCVWVVFSVIAIAFAFASLEIAFVCGIGMISMGGLGHRAFHTLPHAFLNRAFGMLMKIIALGAIVGLGQGNVANWQAAVSPAGPDDFTTACLSVGIMALCYLIVTLKLPASVEASFGGGFAGGLGGGGMVGSLAQRAAGMVARAASRGASGLSARGVSPSGNSRQV
jgi:TrbL/VirB6 plasmid conjugal transfer protein